MINESKLKPQVLLALGMILMAAFSRLIPHAWNFTAIAGMALFAGAHLPNRWLAISVPLVALFLSDLVLGLHSGMVFIYIPFLIIALASFSFLRNPAGKNAWMKIGFSSLAASLFFFAFSNFGVWLSSGMYTRDMQGMITCYAMGLPFLGNQIVGDLFFSGVLFGLLQVASALLKNSVSDSSRAL